MKSYRGGRALILIRLGMIDWNELHWFIIVHSIETQER